MTRLLTTSVLIVGGGPVGLAAAVELGTRGIDCIVLEPRETVSALWPRAKTTSARTMEHFRRWGIADRIRAAAALPVSWSQRVVVATDLLGQELTHFDGCFGLSAERSDVVAEPGQIIPQPFVERVLREVAGDLPSVRLALGWSLQTLTESPDEVVAQAVTSQGRQLRISARYVLGCDGGDSRTRQCLGIPMPGRTDARRTTSVVFRAPGLAELVPHGRAVQYWIFNSRASGAFGRFDLADTWWAGLMLPTPEADPASVLRDLLGPGAPEDLRCEILCTDVWQARMRTAERFGTERVFLVGDAAHLNPPQGGHGFNTGVGDAVNIGWKLAATLRGWGGRRLPGTYGLERRPVAVDTIAAAAANVEAMRDIRPSGAAETAGPAGDRARRVLGKAIHDAMAPEFHSLGLVLGYEYAGSPIVVCDGAPAAAGTSDLTRYSPSTRPGARLPHAWLPDGRSLYDVLGADMTLLTSQGTASALELAARRRAIPLTVVNPREVGLGQDGRTPALLVRPDQHVAWRGDDLSPDEADAVLDRVLCVPGSAGESS